LETGHPFAIGGCGNDYSHITKVGKGL